jgi:hypothetical protein
MSWTSPEDIYWPGKLKIRILHSRSYQLRRNDPGISMVLPEIENPASSYNLEKRRENSATAFVAVAAVSHPRLLISESHFDTSCP